MSLNWRQRRALRAIERELAEQEAPPPTVADRIGWALFVVAIILLVAGLALIDQSLLQGAVLILGSDPPLVVLVAAASRVRG